MKLFVPLLPRADIVKTGFDVGLETLTDRWFVGFLHWDLAAGGQADTPFARVTGHIQENREVAATLIWLVDEEVGEEDINRVAPLLADTLLRNGGMTLTECAAYTALSAPSGSADHTPGRVTISRLEHTPCSTSYQIRFLTEERYQAGAFEDENYLDVATIETFEATEADGSRGERREFATVCITAGAFAVPEKWEPLLRWFADTVTGAAKGQGVFARSPQIFPVHAAYWGRLRPS